MFSDEIVQLKLLYSNRSMNKQREEDVRYFVIAFTGYTESLNIDRK